MIIGHSLLICHENARGVITRHRQLSCRKCVRCMVTGHSQLSRSECARGMVIGHSHLSRRVVVVVVVVDSVPFSAAVFFTAGPWPSSALECHRFLMSVDLFCITVLIKHCQCEYNSYISICFYVAVVLWSVIFMCFAKPIAPAPCWVFL